MSAISGIQGHLLEVTVVGCNKLRDTEWISKQDPYVCLEYASTKFRTRTCTDGGKNPTFQEKFVFSLIEGLREINVAVWNSNTLTMDDFIGSGKVQLHKVLSQGYDDTPWPLQSKSGKHSGEVRLIMHYPNAQKSGIAHAPSAPPFGAAHPSSHAPPAHYAALYAPPAPAPVPSSYPPVGAYPAPSPHPSYPHINPAPYPSSPYPPPPPPSAAYPPHGYPPAPYPAQAYPPPPQAYPYHPPGPPYPGAYPPPY